MKTWISTIVLSLFVFVSAWAADAPPTHDEIFNTNQTSARLLVNYAERVADTASPESKAKEQQRYVMLYDLYIKANSYAMLNKLFFWLSVFSAIMVLLWPSLAVIFKKKLADVEWAKSAIVQTTVTAIAALTFSFYSDYKDKQTYTENLMRHALFSNEDISILSANIAEEISKIDRGFSFSAAMKKPEPAEKPE